MLTWLTADGVRRASASELDTVRVSAGRATGTGVLIGAMIGGVALALGGAYIVGVRCDDVNGCEDDYATALAYGGAVGGGSGALVEAGMGSLVIEWKRVYP